MMARQRILILDDEQDILEIYQEILARLSRIKAETERQKRTPR